jgi:hypothetical protein
MQPAAWEILLMRSSSNKFDPVWLGVVALPVLLSLPAVSASQNGKVPATPAAVASKNLLVNGGFEQHDGLGTIPHGWEAVDEHFGFFRWIAPRVERRIGDVGPRSGEFFAGLDTEKLGVNTSDKEGQICRAALYQTVMVPGRCRGRFSLYYNDLGSTALSHVSAIRLAYTVNSTEISEIRFPAPPQGQLTADRQDGSAPALQTYRANEEQPTLKEDIAPAVWSEPWYRVSQKLPDSQTALGDWSPASIPVAVDAGDEPVRLTLWIGIFDHQHSTEIGYYRVDDASLVMSEK